MHTLHRSSSHHREQGSNVEGGFVRGNENDSKSESVAAVLWTADQVLTCVCIFYLQTKVRAVYQWSSSCGSWEPDWRRWVVRPGPSPSSGSRSSRSAPTWTEPSPDSPDAPPAQTCPRCRHSGRSPWSVWTDRWMSDRKTMSTVCHQLDEKKKTAYTGYCMSTAAKVAYIKACR